MSEQVVLPYTCITCGKSYRNEKSLKSHIVHCKTQFEVVQEMRNQVTDLTSQVAHLKAVIEKLENMLAGTKKEKASAAGGGVGGGCGSSAGGSGGGCKATMSSGNHDKGATGTKNAKTMNAFGHENYSHLISSASTGFVVDIVKQNACFLDALRRVVQKLYRDNDHKENVTVVFKNGAFYIYNGSVWKRIENKTGLMRKVKQRANNVLQHFLTTDTDVFVKAVGQEKYSQLDEFTYRIDTCDDYPEFEKETDHIIFEELTRATDALPLTPPPESV